MLYFMTTGILPYSGLLAEEVVRGVVSGHLRPTWPDTCTTVAAMGSVGVEMGTGAPLALSPLRALCSMCWQTEPRARPAFSQISASLQAIEQAVRLHIQGATVRS